MNRNCGTKQRVPIIIEVYGDFPFFSKIFSLHLKFGFKNHTRKNVKFKAKHCQRINFRETPINLQISTCCCSSPFIFRIHNGCPRNTPHRASFSHAECKIMQTENSALHNNWMKLKTFPLLLLHRRRWRKWFALVRCMVIMRVQKAIPAIVHVEMLDSRIPYCHV